MNSKILLIKGGWSTERDISLKTGRCIEESFLRQGIDHEVLDLVNIKQLYDYDFSSIGYVFNALHGGFGEDGGIQSFVKELGIPMNGADVLASGISMNKNISKVIASTCDITVPMSDFYRSFEEVPSYQELTHELGESFIIKPNNQGCSIGVNLVDSDENFSTKLNQTFSLGDSVLFEEFIKGEEITLCYLEGQVLPIIKINYQQKYFSYSAKFESKETTFFEKYKSSKGFLEKISKLSLKLFKLLGIIDYCRLDFIVREGRAYLLEINSLPGLNEHSVFVTSAKLASISYDELILKIVECKYPMFSRKTPSETA